MLNVVEPFHERASGWLVGLCREPACPTWRYDYYKLSDLQPVQASPEHRLDPGKSLTHKFPVMEEEHFDEPSQDFLGTWPDRGHSGGLPYHQTENYYSTRVLAQRKLIVSTT